jgi:PAS domain S-box-containing protein
MANLQAAQLAGFESVEAMLARGTTALDFLAPEEHDRARTNIQALAEAEVPWNREYVAIRVDGSRFPIELSTSMLWDFEGNPTGMVCMIRDITARKQAEEALAAAAKEWSVSFDAMADGVSLHSPEHVILNVNRALCEILGRTREELIGKKCHEVFHRAGAPFAGCPLQKSLQTHCREDAELYEASLGKWLAASTSPVYDDEGCLVRLVHVVRDVSDRRRADEELLDTQRQAVAANRAKTQFLASMSHEIRTPMTSILGFADLLMGSDLSRDEHMAYLKAIQRNGRVLLDLLNEILDLAKIESGKMSIEPIDCSLRQLIDDVLAVVRMSAQEKGLSLDVIHDGPIPRIIHTDSTKLRQILVNLAGNAVKFTQRGGVRICVRCDPLRQGMSRLQFAVSDTGIGIAPDMLVGLFQPFTLGDTSTTRRFRGTGLGLAISKRLANLLGGDIEVSSEHGQGSTFTLTIEAETVAGVVEPAAACDACAGRVAPVGGGAVDCIHAESTPPA